MPDRSKGQRAGAKIIVFPGIPGWGMGLTTPPQKNLLLRNHYRSQDSDRVVAPVKRKFFYTDKKRGQTHKIMEED
jgi:hypothetical protein